MVLLMKKLFAVFLAVLLAASCFPTAFAAFEPATVEWQVSEPDAQGVVTATLVIKNANFMVVNGMVSYNPAVLQPIQADGTAATSFAEFRTFPTAGYSRCFTEFGCSLDTTAGIISFTNFMMPGTPSYDGLPVGNDLLQADANGIAVYRFSFKVLGTGLYGFGLAYDEDGKGGFILSDGDPEYLSLVFKVIEPNMHPVIEEPVDVLPGDEIPENDAQNLALRANNTVILLIGYANAAANGVILPVDPADASIAPYIKAGADRTMVPVRFIAESLGADVDFVKVEGKVIIIQGGKTIHMFLGRKDWTVNGTQQEPLEAPAELLNDARTFVPLRAIGEALDMHVDWAGGDYAVLISPKDNPIDLSRTIDNRFYIAMISMISTW